MNSDGIILPDAVCRKVKGFGEGRTGRAAEQKAEGFVANRPGPPGFRAADAHFVGSLGRSPATAFATLRVDRLAARETELIPSEFISL